MTLRIDWLGRVAYREALKLQEEALMARRRGGPDRLLLLEHPPVVTLGRSSREENLRVPDAELLRRGIDRVEVARGGDVTFHAPGQLVGYPIVDLAARGAPDVHAHLRAIESTLCSALQRVGVACTVRPGTTGVFVDDPGASVPRKIASIGVGVRGWVSWHGFALNVTLDPKEFEVIVPCGLHEVEMTCVARELGAAAPAGLDAAVRGAVSEAFREGWG